MKTKPVGQLVKEEFNFLVSDFGFLVVEDEVKTGGCSWLFLNATTGVHISYEFKEAYFHLFLHKLSEGRFVENPSAIRSKSKITGFSLDDILDLRNPEARLLPAYQYGAEAEFYTRENGFQLYISRFAENLRRYGSDILRGDFSLFEKLEPVVKYRAALMHR